jgi:hypothetical protein
MYQQGPFLDICKWHRLSRNGSIADQLAPDPERLQLGGERTQTPEKVTSLLECREMGDKRTYQSGPQKCREFGQLQVNRGSF